MLFNLHDVMLMLTAALAVLLAIPMLVKKPRRSADVALAAFILTQGSAALYYLFLFSENFMTSTMELLGGFILIPVVVVFLVQGPLLFWYSNALSGQPTPIKRSDRTVIGIIFVVAILNGLIAQYLKGDAVYPDISFFTSLPSLIVSVIFGHRALMVLQAHGRAIRQQHSNIDEIDLVWLTYTAYGFTGIWILRLLSYVAAMHGAYNLAGVIGEIVNIPTVLLIGWMVTLGLMQRQYQPDKRLDDVGRNGNDERGKSHNPEQVAKLEQLMSSVRVYQDPDLDVDGLADSMGVSSRSLSALINGHYGKNFYEFVNEYRVSEAKRLLEDGDASSMTIQQVFESAGFNSKSTFNTFFKKATGSTPSEYRRAARGGPAMAS
jgi:AraC-like DNA-binding protein